MDPPIQELNLLSTVLLALLDHFDLYTLTRGRGREERRGNERRGGGGHKGQREGK